MTPDTYFKIFLLAVGKDSLAAAFTLGEFFANGGKQVVVNALVQYGGYLGTQAVGNQVTPEMVLPVIANTQLAGKFLQIPGMPPVQERIATLAFTYGAGARSVGFGLPFGISFATADNFGPSNVIPKIPTTVVKPIMKDFRFDFGFSLTFWNRVFKRYKIFFIRIYILFLII